MTPPLTDAELDEIVSDATEALQLDPAATYPDDCLRLVAALREANRLLDGAKPRSCSSDFDSRHPAGGPCQACEWNAAWRQYQEGRKGT